MDRISTTLGSPVGCGCSNVPLRLSPLAPRPPPTLTLTLHSSLLLSLSPDYLSAVYAEMRQLEKSQAEVSSTYTTPRTLLSIIRLSMALAKLRFDTEVRGAYLISSLRF